MPHEPRHGPRWGLWITLVLVGMLAGIALAWSLGLVRGNAGPAARDLAPLPVPAPRSPYPSELPDLSGQSTAAVAPPPAVPVPIEVEPETPMPMAVEPPAPGALPEPKPPRAPVIAPVMRARPATPAPTAASEPRAPPSLPLAIRAAPREARLAPPRHTARTAPHARIVPQPARSLVGPLGSLIVPGDYPAGERRTGEQGDVTVKLSIGANGRVSRCSILAANTSHQLQTATCGLLLARARFAPATDSTGKPIGDTAVQHIAWRRP